MTSVKEFVVEVEPSATELGRGRFVFTDDYSVFDWGKMPDEIPNKGASLCAMGAFNFELLEANDIPTHYRGVVIDGDVRPLASVDEAPREMAIDLTTVPTLPVNGRTYDYDAYHAATGSHYLVPLEVVFRNRVPIGSSLRRRSEPADHGLPFDEWPAEPVDLDEPIIEFSTKYEESDRYLSHEEADDIAGVAPLEDIEIIARTVNRLLTERATETGFTHDDGKIEVLYADGEIRVADVVGTFDENRFTYDGQQISKEVLRQFYKDYDAEWVDAVDAAKAEAKATDVADWRGLCAVSPTQLPSAVISIAGDLYSAGANRYIGRSLLEAPPLDAVMDRLDATLSVE